MGFIEKLKKIKGLPLLCVGLTAAVALIVVGSVDYTLGTPDKSEAAETGTISADEYKKQLEEEITALIGSVAGVGKATVMLTLESGGENVYAYDSADGSREYLTVGSGSSETTVLVRRVTPELRGIAVVCEGGGDPVIQQKLIALICALFDIPSTRVCVTG